MGEGTFVRPLAFYPIALLLPLLLIQLIRGKTSLPRAGALFKGGRMSNKSETLLPLGILL